MKILNITLVLIKTSKQFDGKVFSWRYSAKQLLSYIHGAIVGFRAV